MSLYSILREDQLTARKPVTKNIVVAKLLTTLMGELETRAKKEGTDVSDQMVVAMCKKFISNTNDFIAMGTSEETNVKLNEELAALNKYLPKQLTVQELRVIIVGLNTSNIGVVMKHLNTNHKGCFDGKLAQSLCKELL